MKRFKLTILALCTGMTIISCTDSGESASNSSAANGSTDSSNMTNAGQTTNNDVMNNNAMIAGADSAFAVKAAAGGLMEVEAGRLAEQKAQHPRVKAFAAMMVRDHTAANTELMSLASSGGMNIPGQLPAEHQKMLDNMKNMSGKAFDKHYMGMMVSDHQKTLNDFQVESNNGSHPGLKQWAGGKVPVLIMHRDSATAINGALK